MIQLFVMKSKICVLLCIVLIFIISTSAIINTGPPETHMVPYGVRDATGNPANIGVGNCTGCHTGVLNSSGGSLKIVVKDANGTPVSSYDFNKLYTIEVTVARTSISTFGFDAEVVTKNNTDAGIITSLDTAKIITLQGDRSTNMTHFTPGKTKDSHTFTFQWTTPAADSGVVTIYAAGLAGNGNLKNTGDYTYTSVKTLSPVSSTSIHEYQENIASVSIYPNPVSTAFNLSYQLQQQGYLTINLYTLNGQKVTELLTEEKASGFQQEHIVIPASVKSGIYLLQMNMKNSTAYEKIIINTAE
jgi:hypothetical protein